MTNDKKPQDDNTFSCQHNDSIDFSAFVLSLATAAMSHLGEVPDPATGKTGTSLEGAKEIIDILCMLKDKTRGNLTDEEGRMLEHFLYELRMKYLSKR